VIIEIMFVRSSDLEMNIQGMECVQAYKLKGIMGAHLADQNARAIVFPK
jgi:hypothetical protein